jgi:hypothetical protein
VLQFLYLLYALDLNFKMGPNLVKLIVHYWECKLNAAAALCYKVPITCILLHLFNQCQSFKFCCNILYMVMGHSHLFISHNFHYAGAKYPVSTLLKGCKKWSVSRRHVQHKDEGQTQSSACYTQYALLCTKYWWDLNAYDNFRRTCTTRMRSSCPPTATWSLDICVAFNASFPKIWRFVENCWKCMQYLK